MISVRFAIYLIGTERILEKKPTRLLFIVSVYHTKELMKDWRIAVQPV